MGALGIFSRLLANTGSGVAAYGSGELQGQQVKAERAEKDRLRKIQEAAGEVARINAENAQRRSFTDMLKASEPKAEKPNGWVVNGHRYDTEAEAIAAQQKFATAGRAPKSVKPPTKRTTPYDSAKMDSDVSSRVAGMVQFHQSASAALKAFDDRWKTKGGQPNTLGMKVRAKLAEMAANETLR